jgi:hypothetical protein
MAVDKFSFLTLGGGEEIEDGWVSRKYLIIIFGGASNVKEVDSEKKMFDIE